MLNFAVIVVNACNKSKKKNAHELSDIVRETNGTGSSFLHLLVFGYLSLAGPRFSKVPELFGRVLGDIKCLITKTC